MDHLPVETRAALCLTCKAALDVFEPRDLPETDLRHIRRLFEKHLSERYYYCWDCGHLHRYHRGWDWQIKSNQMAFLRPCQFPNVEIGAWKFGFYRFQLVMNAHVYGPGRGLPTSIMESGTIGKWLAEATMAIREDQLFLSVRYTRTFMGSLGYVYFETQLDRHRLQFCQHLSNRPSPFDPYGAQRLPELQLTRKTKQGSRQLLRAPWSANGSCRTCLTDYTFALNCARPRSRIGSSQQAQYKIEIVTYHQLGACRDPSDWMWQCFAGNPPGQATRQPYLNTDHHPGAVKNRWDAGVKSDEIVTERFGALAN